MPSRTPASTRWPFSPRRLSIARKTQLVIGFALFALLSVLFVPLHAIVLDSFLQLERRNAERSIERALTALEDDLESLASIARDYASWDDTYAYVRGELPEFVGDNFSPTTFEANRLNLVVIVDVRGTVRYSQMYDRVGWLPRAETNAVVGSVLQSRLLDGVNDADGSNGFLLLPRAPIMLAARPILTNENRGPRAGALVMGRLIAPAELGRLGESLGLDLRVHRLDQPAGRPEVQTAIDQLLAGAQEVVTPLGNETVAGYGLLHNLAGQPIGAVEVITPREIWANGVTTLASLLVIFLGTGVGITLTISMLLNRLVLTRLAQLISAVQAIGEERSLARRIAIAGGDELAELAETINGMLDAIEQSEAEGRRAVEARLQIWSDVIEARRQFLSTVSHELRTPLTPIRGYLDMMMMGVAGELTDDQREFLHAMRLSTERMQSLIDDLLDLSRMDATEFSIAPEALDPAAAVDMALKLITPLSERREVSLSAELTGGVGPVWADRRRLEQILVNLISNAVKYTRRGGRAWVRVEQIPEGICFTVADNGVGMTAAQLEKLFTPFYRAENELRDEVSGSGLGLSITKRLVELHGGQILVESTAGVGSIFRVTLPAAV